MKPIVIFAATVGALSSISADAVSVSSRGLGQVLLYPYYTVNDQQTFGASTDWVVALPTKNFYVDPAIVGTTPQSAIAPFTKVFGGGLVAGTPATPGEACDVIVPEVRDRNGLGAPTCGEQCQQQHHFTCLQTNVLDFNHGPGNGSPSGALGSMVIADNVVPAFASGQVVLHTYDPLNITAPALRAANDGTTFLGQPAIGFDAENYINANILPGVLSNYSGAYPHRAQVSCAKSGASCP